MPLNSRSARGENSAAAEATAAQPKFFFGWVIVACAFIILCICYGIQFTFGLFMPFISADTGWDRGSLSLPYSMYVFVYSALGIVTGRLTDRLGPRVVLIVGGGLLGLGAMLMSDVYALWQVYVALGLIAAAGMSAAYVPCNVTVVRWFTRQRGLALSITSSGASFGMFIFPPLAATLIAAHGWRATYLVLGLLAIGGVISCATFIARDPEKLGLLPDGDATPESSAPTTIAPDSPHENWTLDEARRTRTFWLLNVIFTLTWLVVFIPMVHLVPFAMDLGLSQFLAAMTISVSGFAGFAGRLAIGPISDRLGRVPTLGLCLLLQMLAFLGFTISTGASLLYSAAAVFGFSYGGGTALFPALIGDFFGRIAIGAIVGFIFAIAGSAAAFGPFIAGYLYEITKSYQPTFLLSASLNLAALALLFALKRPTRTHHEDL
jgi:MFS family permease